MQLDCPYLGLPQAVLSRVFCSPRLAPRSPSQRHIRVFTAGRAQHRVGKAVCRSSPKGGGGGVSAAGSDLSWSHVARDVKRKLASWAAEGPGRQEELQRWWVGPAVGVRTLTCWQCLLAVPQTAGS